jgi:hypothetical protein
MQPEKMPTKKPKLSLYVDEELVDEVKKLAKSENRSVNNLIETMLRDKVLKAKQEGKI